MQFGRKKARRRKAFRAKPTVARGPLTGVELGDVRSLTQPFARDPFGALRPPLDHTAMQISLELANLAYQLKPDDWFAAGWRDTSIQVDNHLQSGVTVGESENAGSERFRGLLNALKLGRARLALKEYNPLSQVFGAIRQREKSDTIKAITMIHKAEGGRYVVAIGFMGTGSRFYDWFSNFRFMNDEGFHRGFAQLTGYFEESAERILFPDTAAELGLERLTLADVIAELKSPDSRFTLWMAGHSQGGAVMQVFCHRLLHDWGALPRNVLGYGFASPTICAGLKDGDPSAYPLIHVFNSDDMVPRMGSLEQFGLCLVYRAGEEFRRTAYDWQDTDEARQLRVDAERMMAHVVDTPTMLESMVAACRTVLEEKTEESINALMEKRWSIAPLDKAFGFAGNKLSDWVERFSHYAEESYRSLTGRSMEESTVILLQTEMRPIVRRYPLRVLLGGMRERYYAPHKLGREHGLYAAYDYIVSRGQNKLLPFVWHNHADAQPTREYADAYAIVMETPARIAIVRRRALPHTTAHPSARTRGLSRRRLSA